MPTPQIRLKKSAVTGKAPLLDDLSLGELAINYYDGNLYTKQDTGGVGIATTITNLTPWQETYGGGSLSYTGDINVTGNLAVDASTLFVNATNNRIGIGTDNPAYQVEIENTGANALLVLDRTDGAACFIEGQATRSAFGSVNEAPLALAYNSFAVVTIGAAGSITVNPDGDGYTFPTTDGSANQVLQTDGEGNLSFATVSGGGGINNVVDDTTPQLGGNLDLNGNDINGTGNIDITGTLNVSGVSTFSGDANFQNVSVGGTLSLSGSDLTATATELNHLDGVTGITLGTANELLIVGSDGSSIESDGTLNIDPGNNYVGINQPSPEVTLHMTGEGAQTAQIRMEQYNDSADAPDVRTRRYRGTVASPAAVQAGDYLFRSNHEYYNGTSLLVGGAFAFDNTNNANRTQFSVAVDIDGTGADPQGNNGQFKIDGNDSGAITFNNAYKFPTSDGSANQVLQTDGAGNLSFADQTGGGGGADINEVMLFG